MRTSVDVNRLDGVMGHYALSKIVGGWKVTSAVTLTSGFPLTVSAGEETANIGNCCRPNRDFTVSTKADDQTVDRWFNTAAYSRAPNGTFGTAGRSEIIGPGIKNWDFSLSKQFPFADLRYVELRFETFNFLNNPNWGDPNTNLSNMAFGTTPVNVGLPGGKTLLCVTTNAPAATSTSTSIPGLSWP